MHPCSVECLFIQHSYQHTSCQLLDSSFQKPHTHRHTLNVSKTNAAVWCRKQSPSPQFYHSFLQTSERVSKRGE